MELRNVMKNRCLILLVVFFVFSLHQDLICNSILTLPRIEIPEIGLSVNRYEKISDVAQYGDADWSNVIGFARFVTLKQAKQIADSNPSITYFFYVKDPCWEIPSKGVFHLHDAVFFSGTPWWGSARGFSDGYVKIQNCL